MLESSIERRFVSKMKALGILAIKLKLMGNRGLPDRMLLLPGGRVIFIEFKRPGEDLRPLQKHVHKKLLGLNHEVKTFDDANEAAAFVYKAIKIDQR